jgi:putative transposase
LAVVLELYSRRVIGWAIAERMTAALVCDALMMALWRRHRPKAVIVHSASGAASIVLPLTRDLSQNTN